MMEDYTLGFFGRHNSLEDYHVRLCLRVFSVHNTYAQPLAYLSTFLKENNARTVTGRTGINIYADSLEAHRL